MGTVIASCCLGIGQRADELPIVLEIFKPLLERHVGHHPHSRLLNCQSLSGEIVGVPGPVDRRVYACV